MMELRSPFLCLDREIEPQVGEGSCPKSQGGWPGKNQPLEIVELTVSERFTL